MRYHPERPNESNNALTAVRRTSGLVVDELALLCRPRPGIDDVGEQAQTLYEGMFDALASAGSGPESVVSETVFMRQHSTGAEAVGAARSRLLRHSENQSSRPATTYIGQPPLNQEAQLEVSAIAMIPHSPDSLEARGVVLPVACSCAACAKGLPAKVLHCGEQSSLHSANIYGSGQDAVAEAYDMFRAAEALLSDAAMGFGDVIRTWIHLRDIDRDYDALNKARREFFRHTGIEVAPASTGVQGIPISDAHDFSMTLYAAKSPRLACKAISSPTLNEAPSYGADFSRGLRVTDGNKDTLYISGTASIDEAGQTVHVGDFEAQADRMIHNIESLLDGEGATIADLVSGIGYLKNPDDAPKLRSIFKARGFEGFPCALVEAPLCRPELLCETEAVAILPLATTSA